MKANRKFINEEEAVSPVIAVILMVAITVVLAATVFVLVNDLGKNVGSTGPSLGLVSDSAGSSTSQWTIKVSSATKLSDITDYRFVLNTPEHGTTVFNGTWGTQHVERADTDDDNRKWGADGALTVANGGYEVIWTDIDGNDKWSVGDTMRIQFSDGTATTPALGDTYESGEYQLEILHTPSGSSSGSLPRTF